MAARWTTKVFAFKEDAPTPEKDGGMMGFLGFLGFLGNLTLRNTQVTATSTVTASSEEAFRTTCEG